MRAGVGVCVWAFAHCPSCTAMHVCVSVCVCVCVCVCVYQIGC
jgi:hypothetical protein